MIDLKKEKEEILSVIDKEAKVGIKKTKKEAKKIKRRKKIRKRDKDHHLVQDLD